MADPVIVNNPGNSDSSGNGMGFLLGIIVLVVFVILFLYYGLPIIRQSFSGAQINVPSKIDVNVQQAK